MFRRRSVGERLKIIACLIVLVAFGGDDVKAGIIAAFNLADHPDAAEQPPPYGLRVDDLFTIAAMAGAAGGVTTFSFDYFNDVTLTVDDTGAGLEIRITGTVYGGEDTGTGYGFGEGAYALDFTYSTNVAPTASGWQVEPPSAINSGTLTALDDNNGVPRDTVFNLYDKEQHGMMFLFQPDGYRLDGDTTTWVGRGWLTTDPTGLDTGRIMDFIFTSSPPTIPEPATLMLIGAGMIAASPQRWRRRTR